MVTAKLNLRILLCVTLVMILTAEAAEIQDTQEKNSFPFGLSNPYEDKVLENGTVIKELLPDIIKDLGLSEKDGERGYIIDNISRTRAETVNYLGITEYDFDTQVGALINLVVKKGRADLWIVLNPVTINQFSDGQKRKDNKKVPTYLPSGQASREAWRKYLTALIKYLNNKGREATKDENWVVRRYNLFNEVIAEYTQTFGKKNQANVKAYADFVLDSSEIIRELSPGSEIVLGGAAGKFDLGKNSNDTPFYLALFEELALRCPTGFVPFDTFESHWFPAFKGYQNNILGYGVKDFLNFLKKNGQQEKNFVIRAGATYSGIDRREEKKLMDRYQTEHDQAELLIKRFVYNLAAGAKAIPWSTLHEQIAYQGTVHKIFNYVGLLYNGIPSDQKPPAEAEKFWQPCPDPGFGVKKLAYFSFKKLVEELRGSDWDNVVRINTSAKDIYIFKFSRTDKTVYVAWWDWWQTCDRSKKDEDHCLVSATKQSAAGNNAFIQLETCVNNCAKQCIAKKAPKIKFTLANSANGITITEAIPNQATGKEASQKKYNTLFNSTKVPASSSTGKNEVVFTLGSTPLYIEVSR